LEKLILGILSGFLKLKKTIFQSFWGEYFKNRKNLKNFIQAWKILRGGKIP
jgi:hypothetical protein